MIHRYQTHHDVPADDDDSFCARAVMLRHSPYRLRNNTVPISPGGSRFRVAPTLEEYFSSSGMIRIPYVLDVPAFCVNTMDSTRLNLPGMVLIRLGGIYGEMSPDAIAWFVFCLTHVMPLGVVKFKPSTGLAVVRVYLCDAPRVMAIGGKVWCGPFGAICASHILGLISLHANLKRLRNALDASSSCGRPFCPSHLVTTAPWIP